MSSLHRLSKLAPSSLRVGRWYSSWSQPKEVTKLWIGGREVDAINSETFESRDPASGEVLSIVQQAGQSDVDHAVEVAREAQKEWRKLSGTERGRVLRRAGDLLRECNDELAVLETLDNGKPISEANSIDVHSGADALEYFGGIASTIGGEHLQLGNGSWGYTIREPLGVCAGIGAWNYPVQIACWKSAPALACGNAMIFKPAEDTPLTAMKIAEVYKQAGLPDGLFNIVQGDGSTGQLLSRHEGIDKVSFTGEVGTGSLVMKDAADTIKYVTMELGGKSPLIIFEDSDLDNAVSAAMAANFYSQGEVCSNGTRVFVHSSIQKQFLEKLKDRVGKMSVGDPLLPDTDVGALINERHAEKVAKYIENAKSQAELVVGGDRVKVEGRCSQANTFIRPAVFAGCTDDIELVQEEVFGAVCAVLPFETEEEVVARANDTYFGLSAGVFTKDLNRAHRVIADLEAGSCFINNYNITPIEMPFGGHKRSGIGRENGKYAIETYSQIKSVYVEAGDVETPWK